MRKRLTQYAWLIPAACLALPAAAVAGNAAPVVSPASADVIERLDRIERLLDNQSLLDLYNQTQSLQQEVQKLRGELESQQHRIEQMTQRQKDLYADIDQRLQTIEDSDERQAGADTASDDFVIEPEQVDTIDPVADSDMADSPAAGADGAAAPEDAREAYNQAFDQLKAGRYEAAIEAFEQFLQDYPRSDYRPNARYWLGEAHYVQREFEPAIAAYQALLSEHPTSQKAPDALLKIGYSQQEMGERDKARSTLQQLRDEYPDTTAASLARDRLQQLQSGS